MKLNCKNYLIEITVLLNIFLTLKVSGEKIFATKVFIYPIKPSLFNWTLKVDEDIIYRPTLLNAPDLPKWIEYLFSKKHKTGFLYGVPPKEEDKLEIVSTSFFHKMNTKRNFTWVQVEIIGQRSKTYDTRRKIIHLNIENISQPATHEVHLKIDNLNVEDFFDLHQMTRLLKIFKHKLWKKSASNLYFTYLISAVSLGARRPLRPTEGEGVVIRLGSTAEFSSNLLELQEEVKPLWKIQYCPRDFKRTSVERIFRDEGFILDWCNFKLIKNFQNSKKSFENNIQPYFEPEFFKEPLWLRPAKAEIICRSYNSEFALIIVVPALLMIFLVILLSVILGIQIEGMKNESDEFFDSIFHICETRFRKKEELVTSQIFLPQVSSCYASKLNESIPSRIAAHQDARIIVTNGPTRPTPPPYNEALKKNVVDF